MVVVPGNQGGDDEACTWTGHCLGDPCASENDCDSNWVCTNRKCAWSDEEYTDGGEEEYYEPEAPAADPRVSTVYYTVWPRATAAP